MAASDDATGAETEALSDATCNGIDEEAVDAADETGTDAAVNASSGVADNVAGVSTRGATGDDVCFGVVSFWGIKGCADELRRWIGSPAFFLRDLRRAIFVSISVFAGVIGKERGEEGTRSDA